MDMFDLTGRVGVVTGGNRGIGLGFAIGLAKAGASVAIWSRDEERNASAVAVLSEYGPAAAVASSVTDEADLEAARDATVDRFGRIDSMFANAGTTGVGRFEEMDLAEWQRVIDVNLTGVFLSMKVASQQMIRQGDGGSIVATASIAAAIALPQAPHYTATKGGVVQLAKAAAVRFARYGIRVNVISPGWIETEMTEGVRAHDPSNQQALDRTPMRRWGRPEDLEGPAVFLASDASRFMTGAELLVDGGFRAG